MLTRGRGACYLSNTILYIKVFNKEYMNDLHLAYDL